MHFEDISRVAEEMWAVWRHEFGGPSWQDADGYMKNRFRAMAWRAIKKLREMHYIDDLLVNAGHDQGR
jgi:hypothetical protein